MTAIEPDSTGFEAHTKDVANMLKILIHRIKPVVVETALTIPGAGFFSGSIGQFIKLIDCGYYHFAHQNTLRYIQPRSANDTTSAPPTTK